MRVSVALALIALIGTTSAVASAQSGSGRESTKKVQKGKKKPKKKKAPEGPNMDSNDPVAREQSDEGQFAPRGVTGELKAQEIARRPKKREKAFVAPPHDPFVVFGDFVLGFGQAPKYGPANDSLTPDGTVFSAVVGATFDPFPDFSAGLLIPWSTATLKLESGTGNEQEMAFGSPKIFGEYRVKLTPQLNLPIALGVGIPLTPGNPDPNVGSRDHVSERKAWVSYLADAARGWRDGELFAPKRVPITVSVGVNYHNRALRAYASDKLILGIDTGTTLVERFPPYPAGGHLLVNKTALRNVTLLGATYDLLEKPELWAGLDVWAAYDAVEAIDYESSGVVEGSPFQFVVEPRVGARFGNLRPNLGFIYPLGGRLGEAGTTAFRARVEYAF